MSYLDRLRNEISATETNLAELRKKYQEESVRPQHCCGATGFGYEPTDRCPRCEYDKI